MHTGGIGMPGGTVCMRLPGGGRFPVYGRIGKSQTEALRGTPPDGKEKKQRQAGEENSADNALTNSSGKRSGPVPDSIYYQTACPEDISGDRTLQERTFENDTAKG